MKFAKIAGVAGFVIALATAAAAQPPAAAPATPKPDPTAPAKPLPPSLKPNRIRGTGITVVDIDKERAFYTNVMGMVFIRQPNANEIVLGYKTGTTEQAALVLLKGKPQPGSTTYGRMILDVPDAPALAEHLNSIGWTARGF